jgi:SAM-dependent methyltransferase
MSAWDEGTYELTAARLQAATDVLIASLDLPAGARVLDVGCGTGNAALAAARAGWEAVGVDPAQRLLGVARERAAAEGLTARFDAGDATALPYADAAFDAAISVFGVIFADPPAAAAELLRVTRPGGTIAFTTWLPGGVAGRVMEILRGRAAAPSPWNDPRALFVGRAVATTEHELAFTAPSPEAYVREHLDHHPLAQDAGSREQHARIFEEVAAANEDPSAFRTTSRYLVVTVAV